MPKTQSFNPPALFRTILCPVDFSDHSAVALQYAAILAKRSAGRLHVFHVNDPMLAAAAAVAFADPGYAKVALAELRPFVAKAVPKNTRKAISIHYAADTGDASRQIASAATKSGCDLIVMGTHGLSGLEKVLIGSTTERMLRRSSVPILAVPSIPVEQTAHRRRGAGGPGRRSWSRWTLASNRRAICVTRSSSPERLGRPSCWCTWYAHFRRHRGTGPIWRLTTEC